uniref:Uncharacterized protein n=1 Tax=Tetradesmus obliquus TaxID=3088 RepID=A0A383WJ06_TETOB
MQQASGLQVDLLRSNRSFNAAQAQVNEMMRGLLGLDLGNGNNSNGAAAPSPFGGLTGLLAMAARLTGSNSPSGAAAFAAAQEAALARGGGGGSSSSSSSGTGHSSSQGPSTGHSSRPAPSTAAAGARGHVTSRGSSSAAGRCCGVCAWPGHKMECKEKRKALLAAAEAIAEQYF